MNYNLKTS